MEYEKMAWKFIDLYFSQSDDGTNVLIKHQKDSFDEFINKKLNQIFINIKNFNSIKIYSLDFNFVHNYLLPHHEFGVVPALSSLFVI